MDTPDEIRFNGNSKKSLTVVWVNNWINRFYAEIDIWIDDKMNWRRQKGLTLVEMVLAMAMIVIVLSSLLPQFRVMSQSWDLRQASAETLQNSRVFTDHLERVLAQAVTITAVSLSTDNNGYIEFSAPDGNNYRCDCSANYIRFGLAGQQQMMAGPVSGLRFTCYSVSDLSTPTTAPSSVDYIQVDTAFTDSTGHNQNETVSINVMLARTSASRGSGSSQLHLELDEMTGLTAADSSGNGLTGQLHFSSSNPWSAGINGNALNFNGASDVVTLLDHVILDLTDQGTVAAWIYIEAYRTFAGIIHKGDRSDFSDEAYTLQFWTSNYMMFSVSNDSTSVMVIDTVAPSLRQWHHVLGKWDSSGVYLYVDGVRRAWDPTVIVARNSSGGLNIGAQLYGDPHSYYGIIPFCGKIDDVQIYSYALSESQIQQLAQVP
jgi:type II secretory pathway pseudopilin PulG